MIVVPSHRASRSWTALPLLAVATSLALLDTSSQRPAHAAEGEGASASAAARKATGKVTTTSATAVSGGPGCRLKAIGLRKATSTFKAELKSRDGGLQVLSEDQAFGCELDGTQDLSGAKDCRFRVFGGQAQVEVLCPKEKVKGKQEGAGWQLTLSGCKAKKGACEIAADLTVSLKPDP
jgi:hypothetical protein